MKYIIFLVFIVLCGCGGGSSPHSAADDFIKDERPEKEAAPLNAEERETEDKASTKSHDPLHAVKAGGWPKDVQKQTILEIRDSSVSFSLKDFFKLYSGAKVIEGFPKKDGRHFNLILPDTGRVITLIGHIDEIKYVSTDLHFDKDPNLRKFHLRQCALLFSTLMPDDFEKFVRWLDQCALAKNAAGRDSTTRITRSFGKHSGAKAEYNHIGSLGITMIKLDIQLLSKS